MMGVFGRIRESLARTKQQIVSRFEEIARQADEALGPSRTVTTVELETVEALEELLISADIGMAATARIVEAVQARAARGGLRELVKKELRGIFAAVDHPPTVMGTPTVTLIVGVNGTGKTTTVGKLANLLKRE